MDVSGDVQELVHAPVESREVAVHPADDGRHAETPLVELEDGDHRKSDRRFSTPDRNPAPKRKGNDDDHQDAKFQCVHDSPDTDMPEDDGIDIDGIEKMILLKKKQDDVDKHIIASWIFGVDITEIYSPDRINEVARR